MHIALAHSPDAWKDAELVVMSQTVLCEQARVAAGSTRLVRDSIGQGRTPARARARASETRVTLKSAPSFSRFLFLLLLMHPRHSVCMLTCTTWACSHPHPCPRIHLRDSHLVTLVRRRVTRLRPRRPGRCRLCSTWRAPWSAPAGRPAKKRKVEAAAPDGPSAEEARRLVVIDALHSTLGTQRADEEPQTAFVGVSRAPQPPSGRLRWSTY